MRRGVHGEYPRVKSCECVGLGVLRPYIKHALREWQISEAPGWIGPLGVRQCIELVHGYLDLVKGLTEEERVWHVGRRRRGPVCGSRDVVKSGIAGKARSVVAPLTRASRRLVRASRRLVRISLRISEERM